MVRTSGWTAIAVVAAVFAAPNVVAAQDARRFDEQLLEVFTYRNTGPFRMGARISDIAVPAAPAKDHLHTFYVATWSGGLWKTTNNGTTFEPVFDGQRKLAIGDVAVAPSNPDIVWVGTGDGFTSRSSYAGDGVYRSIDAGRTWQNMGLPDSHHIARIVIHPTNPDIVYVAAMGHLYSENEERGVFRTTDGGASWEKMNNNMPNVAVHDLLVHPRDKDLVLGTYGRGLWLTDIAPLQELNAKVLASDLHLFTIQPVVQRMPWSFGANDYLFADRHIRTPNEPNGMVIRYYLKDTASSTARVTITDAGGREVARLEGGTAAGINTVVWNTRAPRDAGGSGAGRGRGDDRDVLAQWAPLDEYTVTLDVGGTVRTQKARITATQGWTLGPFPRVIR